MHAMLAVHSWIEQDVWASLLPFVQLAVIRSFRTSMHGTPLFLVLGRQDRLPVGLKLGTCIPRVTSTADTEVFYKIPEVTYT